MLCPRVLLLCSEKVFSRQRIWEHFGWNSIYPHWGDTVCFPFLTLWSLCLKVLSSLLIPIPCYWLLLLTCKSPASRNDFLGSHFSLGYHVLLWTKSHVLGGTLCFREVWLLFFEGRGVRRVVSSTEIRIIANKSWNLAAYYYLQLTCSSTEWKKFLLLFPFPSVLSATSSCWQWRPFNAHKRTDSFACIA